MGRRAATLSLVVLVVLVALACYGPSSNADKPPTRPTEKRPVELTFDMTRDKGGLKIVYTVRNRSAGRIWVAAELLQNTPSGQVMKATDQLIVRNGRDPDVVSLVRGMAYDSVGNRERPAPSPAMTAVAAGHELRGEALIPLPLTAWHNYARIEPLAGEKRRAVLEITYVTEPDKADAWEHVPLEDGRTVTAPNPYFLKGAAKQLVSEPRPLP